MEAPLLDAITQNTPGYSQAYAAGVPRSFNWCAGSYKPFGNTPPTDFTAVTAWGQVYPRLGASGLIPPPGATIEVTDAQTYVRLKAGRKWVLVQTQNIAGVAGGHFVANFSGNSDVAMTVTIQPDGKATFSAPKKGYNSHFWLVRRGTYDPGAVDGVYVQLKMRVADPNADFVANVGADWWRNVSASFVQGFRNNPGAGMSNWIKLSTEWSTLYFYSISAAQFAAYPPPPLVESVAEGIQVLKPIRVNLWSPCSP